MTVPVITVDAAFGSNPGGTAFSWTNIHSDSGTQRVRALSYRRGRQNELNRIETGTGSLTLADRNSDFDPSNSAGTYHASIRPYVPVRAQATLMNLVTNGGFETSTAGWGASGSATIATSAAFAKFGSQSLRVVASGVDGGAYVPTFVAVSPSTTYSFSLYVAPDASNASLRLRWFEYTAGSVYTGTAQTTVFTGLAVGWQRVTLTATTGATTAQVQLEVTSPAVTGFYLDGVQFEASNFAHDYIDTNGTAVNVTYDLFQHFVTRWPRTLRDVRYTERSIETADGFEWFARAGVAGGTYASETSGTRVVNVLDHVGWSSSMRNLTGGQSTLGSVTFDPDDSTKALSHLLDVADSENGLFYMDSAGKAKFVQRTDLVTGTAYSVSQATFRDGAVGGTTGYPFTSNTPSYDLDTTFNDFRGSRAGGTTTQVATDTSSAATYGLRTSTFTSLVNSDNDLLAQAQWRLGKFKNPLNRLEQITVMPGTQTSFWQTILALDIGNRVTVIEKPPGYSGTVTADYVIQSLDVAFTAGPVQSAKFTYGLWPADTNTYWQLGVAGFSELDTTTRLAY